MNYCILKRERLTDTTWSVKYERWGDCRCDKEELTIEVDTGPKMPTLPDVIAKEKALAK